ncbi:MAG: fleN [Herminiimonas sp.]|nr:fleN [Herminiimonas sp.]
MLINLGASLARAGNAVLLLDACSASRGIVARMNISDGATLLQAARRERALSDVVRAMPQGFGVATLMRGPLNAAMPDAERARLAAAFGALAKASDVVVIDAELSPDDSFPLPAMAEGEIVVQVSAGAASIKSAYSIIKRLNARLGRRPFSILVTGASDQHAQMVFQNMAQAASRYLALELNSIGSVPADEHLTRAARLGRTVIDAFPLAGASVAFRHLAGRFVRSDMTPSGAVLGA